MMFRGPGDRGRRIFGWAMRVSTALFAVASIYGWVFFFTVGQSHGPGLELGLLGAFLAVVAWVSAKQVFS